MEPLKKVKEEKAKRSLNRPLKLHWTSLVEKQLSPISCCALSPGSGVLAVARERPCVEFYQVQEGRLLLLTTHLLPKHQRLTRVQWLDDSLLATVSLNGLATVFSLA